MGLKYRLTEQYQWLLCRVSAITLIVATLVGQYGETEHGKVATSIALAVLMLLFGGLAFLLGARAANYGNVSPDRQALVALAICVPLLPIGWATYGMLQSSGPMSYIAGMLACFLWQGPNVIQHWRG